MSVYTTLSPAELEPWLTRHQFGCLLDMAGIAEGIQNTNYFVDTDKGRFVLTLFERVDVAQLPLYLRLMAHLAKRGIPCPAPLAMHDGSLLGSLRDKPAALFTRLSGTAVITPNKAQCAAIGHTLAQLHLAGADFDAPPHPRGLDWIATAAARVAPCLPPQDAERLNGEVRHHQQNPTAELPGGAIHADLFRDNVLFLGDAIGGLLDFYFAGHGDFLFDLAVLVNDWCSEGPEGQLDPARMQAILRAYEGVRPLTADEKKAWPDALRRAALRFWVSRLEDFHFPFYAPQPGEAVTVRDPHAFGRLLQQRISHFPDACRL